MTSQYFDIDDILAEDERIPVEWRTPAKNVGHLDASCGKNDVAVKDKMNLPLWLAEGMAERNLIHADLPRDYLQDVLASEVLPDPEVAKLGAMSPNYYSVALRLASFANMGAGTDESTLIREMKEIFADRIGHFLRKAVNSDGRDTSFTQQTMTGTENALFYSLLEFTKLNSAWKRRQLERLGQENRIGTSSKSHTLKRSRSVLTEN